MNKKYWEERYKKNGHAKTVGDSRWNAEQYQQQNDEIKLNIKQAMAEELFSGEFAGKNVADYGCGSSRFTEFIIENFLPAIYYGYDIVDEVIEYDQMIERAKPHHHCQVLFRPIDVMVVETDFSMIFCAFVLQHIVEDSDLLFTLKNWRVMLEHDGMALVITNVFKAKSNEYIHFRSVQEYEAAFDAIGFKHELKWVKKIGGEDHACFILKI